MEQRRFVGDGVFLHSLPYTITKDISQRRKRRIFRQTDALLFLTDNRWHKGAQSILTAAEMRRENYRAPGC